MKKILLYAFFLVCSLSATAQVSYPVNGSHDVRPGLYAFTNANIVVSADQTISNGTLLVKQDRIEAVGTDITIPKGYVVIDLKGKYIYPADRCLYQLRFAGACPPSGWRIWRYACLHIN
jgi:hypothetical protein